MKKQEKLTITTIAQLANTSKTTISFYLNGRFDKMSPQTKDRIDTIIKQTNYTPNQAARILNSKSSKLIGVIIGDITNSFTNQVIKGIESIAKTEGYQLIIGSSNYQNEDEIKYVENMLTMGVDGFIIQPTYNFKALELIKKANKPLIFIDSNLDNNEISIKANTYKSCKEITTKLINKGYDEFILLSGDPAVLSTRQERLDAVISTLDAHKITYQLQLIDYHFTSDEVKKYLDSCLKLNKKTCIFSLNCWALPNIYMALKAYHNLIPQTIGLVGFDSTEWTLFSNPSITTIVQPAFDEGSLSCQYLLEEIQGSTLKKGTTYIDCTINHLDSTDRKL